MSTKGATLAPALTVDGDVFAEASYAVLAKRGAGKTYTGRVMAEEMYRLGVPFAALDPTGAWWGLRSSADGERDGLPVVIFGGDHADVPLERGAGKVVADLLVRERIPMVLDLSGFGSHAAEREFAKDFLERVYRTNRDLLHLFVDEADLFAPQQPQPGDRPLLGVMENIVRRGRIKGLTITLITQRSAVLNKDVLTQVDVLVLLRLLAPQDRKAVMEWIKAHSTEEQQDEVFGSLAGFQNGEAWWWAPELDVLERIQVREAKTFDSSPTPRRGHRRVEPKTMADVDLSAIKEQIAATIERQKADDPRELRKRIRELESAAAAPAERVEVVKPVMPDFVLGRVIDAEGQARALMNQAKMHFDQVVALRNDVEDMNDPAELASVIAASAPTPARPAPKVAPRDAAVRDALPRDSTVSTPQQRILDALAWFEAIGVTTPKRTVVAAVAGVSSKSSGFRANVSTLSGLGLVAYPEKGQLALTDDGRAQATPPPAVPTVEDLHAEVCRMLSRPQADLLTALIDAYPAALSRDELAARVGVSSASSGFRANVSTLSGFELARYPTKGEVAATDLLFPA